jgi:hypothetical protein
MGWYINGRWWLALIVVLFPLPLGYGWGYPGWGPWYRRRPTVTTIAALGWHR